MTSPDGYGQLLLLRHGIAEERRPDHPDAGRALTSRGKERTAAVVRRLVSLDLRAERLLSSPLRRARQTADLAVAGGLAPAVDELAALAPACGGLEALQSLLAQGTAAERLLLVGHEPDLGDLAAALIGAPPGSLALKKAGLALLERCPPEGWRLRLLIGPKALLEPAPLLEC